MCVDRGRLRGVRDPEGTRSRCCPASRKVDDPDNTVIVPVVDTEKRQALLHGVNRWRILKRQSARNRLESVVDREKAAHGEYRHVDRSTLKSSGVTLGNSETSGPRKGLTPLRMPDKHREFRSRWSDARQAKSLVEKRRRASKSRRA